MRHGGSVFLRVIRLTRGVGKRSISYFCRQGRPSAFQPAMVPRCPAASGYALEAAGDVGRVLKTCRRRQFRRRPAASAGAAHEKELVLRRQPRFAQMVEEAGIDLHGRIDLPGISTGCLPACSRSGSPVKAHSGSVLTSRISAAAQGVGFAAGALEATVWHCAEQGLLAGSNRAAQDVQFALAALRSEVAAARSMLQVVCDLVDAGGGNPTAAVSMAKLHCTALGVRVSARCVEILGEDGDLVDLGVERRLRDAKIAEIYDGTNQVQSMLVARDLRADER